MAFASSPTDLLTAAAAAAASGRALWVGFLACESARVRAWPPIASRPRPRPLHTLPCCQLNCTRDLLFASCRRPPSLLLFTIHTSSARCLRPAHHYCNPPSQPAKPLHNGSAQLILPARAVLCPYAGPLIDHQRASTLEHPTSRPIPTVGDDSTSYHLKRFCCNAELIREELKASCDFPAREESAHVRLDFSNNTSTLCALFG